MRLVSIASGSSGNCIYVGTDNTHILVDTGISRKRIEEGLNSIDLSIKDMDAILVTHEHSDHIKGLGVISRKDAVPIYGTRGTIKGIRACGTLGEVDSQLYNTLSIDVPFLIGDITVNPFKTYHDANEPCAYTFCSGSKKAGIITDTGKYDENIVNRLLGCNALLIEANHDINMLQVGPYPYVLKQRILSDSGHMSNETCARLLGKVLSDGLSGVLLGHISKENNYEQLAFETVRTEIDLNDTKYKAADFNIKIAGRESVTCLKEF